MKNINININKINNTNNIRYILLIRTYELFKMIFNLLFVVGNYNIMLSVIHIFIIYLNYILPKYVLFLKKLVENFYKYNIINKLYSKIEKYNYNNIQKTLENPIPKKGNVPTNILEYYKILFCIKLLNNYFYKKTLNKELFNKIKNPSINISEKIIKYFYEINIINIFNGLNRLQKKTNINIYNKETIEKYLFI